MNRLGQVLLCAFFIMGWPGEPCSAQYDEFDSSHIAEMEREALTEALDEFGLSLDSPELEGMDEGEVWEYIERLRCGNFSRVSINTNFILENRPIGLIFLPSHTNL